MKGNFHVRFLEGSGLATARSHSVKTHLPELQGRELQEAAAGAVSETGGICHAVGCRSLTSREAAPASINIVGTAGAVVGAYGSIVVKLQKFSDRIIYFTKQAPLIY